MSQDENAMMMSEFLDKGDCRVLLITLTSAGALQSSNEFPTTLKNKSIYFVKRYVYTIKLLLCSLKPQLNSIIDTSIFNNSALGIITIFSNQTFVL